MLRFALCLHSVLVQPSSSSSLAAPPCWPLARARALQLPIAMVSIEPCKNIEHAFVPADDDDGEDRQWWWAPSCPGNHTEELGIDDIGKCSKASWTKACCWSYESEHSVRCYLAQHMIASNSHSVEEAYAKEIALSVEISNGIETFADRCQYRKSLQNQYKKAQDEGWEEDKGKGKGKGKSKDKGKGKGKDKASDLGVQMKRNNEVVDKLVSTVDKLSKIARRDDAAELALPGGSRPGGSRSSGSGESAVVPIAIADLELVKDSLNRAANACEQCEQVAARLAKTFAGEQKVLTKAKDILEALVLKHKSSESGGVRLA